MSLFGHCCFFDLSCVVQIAPTVEFSPLLPGYLRDLFSIHGPLVGLAFSSWFCSLPGGASGLQEVLSSYPGMPSLQVQALEEENPMGSLMTLQRRMSLDLYRCFLYLSPFSGTQLEVFAQEVGFEQLRVLDATCCNSVSCL